MPNRFPQDNYYPYRQSFRFSTRQTATLASWVALFVLLSLVTLQLIHLMNPSDFEHPDTNSSEQLPLPINPAKNPSALVVESVAQSAKRPVAPDLFLSTNQPFNQRSVRLPNPAVADPSSKTSGNAIANAGPVAGGLTSKNSRRFSKFRCAGNEKSIDARRERVCVFENVCYNLGTKDWAYYIRPDSSRKPILFDQSRGERFDFWDEGLGFVALSGFTQGLTDWGPKVHASVSPAITSPDSTKTLTSLHALFHLAVHDDNLGHLLWEEMGALWYDMIRLNAFSTDLVAMHALEPLPDRKLNKKFRNAFFKALTPNEPVTMETYLDGFGKSGVVKDVCFDELLVGGNMLRFFENSGWHNFGHEPLFYSLRNRILDVHGLDHDALPAKHRIVFTNKTETLKKQMDGGLVSNRGVANLGEVVQQVRLAYPAVEVVVVEWHKMEIKEQLELLQGTTVFVTPSGGVSTLLPFLPEGAHAIVVDYYERKGDPYYGTVAKASVSMEAPMWNHWPHVKKLYYQVWGAADLVSDVPGKTVEQVDWRYEVSTRLDVGRLKSLIETAFEDMEP
ncbi:hypothetical protein HDU98_005899 [Podochytrium sp. JEL0797]|nr:hypothetical protein HDU98_005899 [Podochytrium sp. JEL0797]